MFNSFALLFTNWSWELLLVSKQAMHSEKNFQIIFQVIIVFLKQYNYMLELNKQQTDNKIIKLISPQESHMNILDYPIFKSTASSSNLFFFSHYFFPSVTTHHTVRNGCSLWISLWGFLLSLQFLPLLPILEALALFFFFFSACYCTLPKIMFLWYPMLTKLL